MAKKKSGEFSYDAAMKELQDIAAQLQGDTISIDDLAEKVSRATELIRLCREKLRHTEREIQELNEEK
jgi:exodeoxyribonuclease VII small subunit